MAQILRSEQLLDYDPGMGQNLVAGAEAGAGVLGEFLKKKRELAQDKLYRDAIKREMGMDVPEGAGEAAWTEVFKNKMSANDPATQLENALKAEALGLRRDELGVRTRGMDMTNDMNKQRLALEQEKLKAIQSNNSMRAQQIQAQIDAMKQQQEQAQNLQAGGGFRPKSIKVGDVTLEAVPTPEEQAQAKREKLEQSPIYQENKNKRLEKLYGLVEGNKVKKEQITSARDATGRIATGIGGKLQRGWMKFFDSDNPQLQDWQKIKMVLTDATLMNTAKTKGAISDREMELFQKAAADDDVASIAAMKPVFDKLVSSLDADEAASMGSFERMYGEDPREYLGVDKNNRSFATEQEAEAANLPPGTVITINGRKARID